jgi:hypothetical protein
MHRAFETAIFKKFPSIDRKRTSGPSKQRHRPRTTRRQICVCAFTQFRPYRRHLQLQGNPSRMALLVFLSARGGVYGRVVSGAERV